jgi:hypothetical protein
MALRGSYPITVQDAYGRHRLLAKLYLKGKDRPNILAAIELHVRLNATEDHFERGTQRIDSEPSEGTWGGLSSVTNCGEVISVDSKAQDRTASKEPLITLFPQSGA